MGAEWEHVSDIHVLVLPYPVQGHINPMLQFGKRLAHIGGGGGVRCTLAITPYLLRQCQDPCPGAVHLVEISDGFDSAGFEEVGDVAAYLAGMESAGSRTLDELLRSEAEKGRPIHAVVYDAFLQPWVPRVARLHGAACVSFFTRAAAVNVAYSRVGKIEEGLPAGFEAEDLPTFLTLPLPYQDMLLSQFVGLDAVDHVLVNSFHELQPQESAYMESTWGAKTVGPTVPSAYLDKRITDDVSYGFHLYTPMTATTKAWLDAQPPRSVTYVSFGSMATPGPTEMAEMAEGLHSSGKAFLWVVRASEASKIPDGFQERVGGRGLVVTWVAQLEVLAHGAIGCFVTHCGWNSTMEALGAGVPMVAVPQWSDQPTNAKFVEDVWCVGVRARRDPEGVVRREELERCIREVTGDDKYACNALDWKEKSKRAMSQGGSSDMNITEFLQALRSSRKSSEAKSIEPLLVGLDA